MRLIIVFGLLFAQCVNTFAQVKKVSVKLVFHEGVNKKKLNISFDNGLIEQRLIMSKHNTGNEELIETECYAPYLKISVVGLYKKDVFDNNEDFYANAESGRIDFFKNPNRKGNSPYQLKFEGVLDDIGQRNHKNAIRKEVEEMAALRENPELATNDSLLMTYGIKPSLIRKKEMDLIKTHSSDFYYQELFFEKIEHWSYVINKKEILNFYVNNFDENFRKSVYGKRIAGKISDLELDEGSIAPEFSQRALDGTIIDLNNYKNKYVLIDFWATWCKPCIQKLPTIQDLAKKYKHKNLVTILVSVDSDENVWENYIKENNLDMIHIRDSDETIAGLWKISVIPQAFLIDKGGKIIYSTKASNDDFLIKLKDILEKI